MKLSIPQSSAPSIQNQPLRLAMLGVGYVGLVAAACMASLGHQVVALDIDDDKIARLQDGEVGIHEEGLGELIREQVTAGRLSFTTEPDVAVPAADIVFVAVGTPPQEDGSADLSAIEAVTVQLRGRVRAPAIVVIKSTVPVGTAQRMQAQLAGEGGDGPRVLVNPEFLRAGTAVTDFLRPDRVILGDDQAPGPDRERLKAVYAPLLEAGVPLFEMDTRSAELAKCAANAMLAARISFMNEISSIAMATGADIDQVRRGVGSDPRIGMAFLQAGMGYGGSCLGKDVSALREAARRSNLRSDMLLAIERVNNRQRCWAFDAMRRDLGGRSPMRGMRVALWGLAFKPGTDDMREAPSLALIDRLWQAGVELHLHDPVAMAPARDCIHETRRIHFAGSADDAVGPVDALVLVTEWPQYVATDPARLATLTRARTVYDARNCLDAKAWARAGWRVVQVGRPSATAKASVESPVHGLTEESAMSDIQLAEDCG